MKNHDRDLRPVILRYFTFDRGLTILMPIIGILLGLAAASFIIQMQGVNPLQAYKEMFLGAFGSATDFSFTLLQFIPLAFAGLAVMFAFRGGSFNIGAEGQIFLGGLASAWFALTFPNLPAVLLTTLSLLAGAGRGRVFCMDRRRAESATRHKRSARNDPHELSWYVLRRICGQHVPKRA